MRRTPFRPDREISQTYNSGVLTVYSVNDAAEPGYAPRPSLTKKVDLRYEEQRLGLNRYYSAKQNDVQVERVVRVQRVSCVSPQDVAVLFGGRQYRIDLVQTVDGVFPPSLDLTLARDDQVYPVSNSDAGNLDDHPGI